MQPLPHHYQVHAKSGSDSLVQLNSGSLEPILSAPPVQFGGDGKHWSPEDLLLAAVADCYILSFKAVAKGSNFEWQDLVCDVQGLLERVEKVNRFTTFTLNVTLSCKAGVDQAKAESLLEKAKAVCLISNSLNASFTLTSTLVVGD